MKLELVNDTTTERSPEGPWAHRPRNLMAAEQRMGRRLTAPDRATVREPAEAMNFSGIPARRRWFQTGLIGFWMAALLAGLSSGCSIKKMAINAAANALAGGSTTSSSDDDPELIKAAAPFSLKLMESLLSQSPRHRGLLLAAASGFTQYAYAFVQQEADEAEDKDLKAAGRLRGRARKLYLRARNYGLRGLEVSHPGFEKLLRADPAAAVKEAGVADVPLLYWTAVSWAGAISLSKDQPEMIAELPVVEALIYRALELKEHFDHGAIHTFLITYEMSRQGAEGRPEDRARRHFERAVELSEGQQAGPFVAMAESVCVQKQNLPEFKSLLQRALAVNPDTQPESRLVNLVMQRRARWLLGRIDQLFLVTDATDKNEGKK